MLLRILSISSAALLLCACVASAPPASPHPIVTSWPVDPTAGVATLAMTYAPEFKVGSFRVVSTSEQLRETWRDFGFRGPVPALDFRERQAVVFVEGGVCGDRGGGRGGQPLLGAWLLDDGSVVPLFEEREQVVCEDSGRDVRTGFAYLLALPRVDSVRITRVVVGERGELRGMKLPNEVPATTAARPLQGLGSERVTLVSRSDGTPVWVVAHADGSTSALGADYEFMPELLPGLRASVRFNPRTRRFTGPFDEWGSHLSGNQLGLVRYALLVRDGRIEIGEAIGRVPAGRPRLSARTSYSIEASFATPGPFDAVPRRSLSEAVRMPAGTLSIVRGRVRLDESNNAALCAEDASSGEGCVSVRDVHASAGCSGYFAGDFVVQGESPDSVSHLVALSFDSDFACRTHEGVRPWWEPHGAWGLQPVTAAFSFGGFAGFGGSELELGAELSAALRFRHSKWARASLIRAQSGDVFELALRARWFDQPRQHGKPAWALGVAPMLLDRAAFSHWSTPTLLGLALPELGFVAQEQRYNAYLAWRLPIEYRAHPLRQHPYFPEERLAWFVAPEFVLELGDAAERWRAGVAGGFSIW